MHSKLPLGEPGPNRFDAVLFDFGGTLDADGVPSLEQFLRAYRSLGGRRSTEEFEATFHVSDRQLAADPATRARGLHDTVLEQSRLIVAGLGEENLDPTACAAAVYSAALAIAARNIAVLRGLRDRGLRLGAVSNFTGNLDRCLAELGLAPLLDIIIDSALVGVRKPDTAIFVRALEQLDVPASRVLMVGDNPFADIRAAASLGMATCWVAPLARPVPDGCAPTFRLEGLAELPRLLDLAFPSAVATPCTG